VLPGERVLAEAREEKPGLLRARLREVLEPAPDRVAASCEYFTRCGGCHYQHARYERQLEIKRDILIEELRRLGKIEPPGDIDIISAEPWGYRNRAQLHVEENAIGYWEARSHKLCAIDHCPISSPKINEAIGKLARMVRDPRWPRFLRSLELFTDENGLQLNVTETARPVARRFFEWCVAELPGMVDGPLDYDGRFRVSGNSFFQSNRFLVDRLVEVALEGASGESALDLYAGVGLFALEMGRRFREVTAVESGAAAVRDLLFNAERAGLTNVRAEQASVPDFLRGMEKAPDLVLLDPPRTGLGKEVVAQLSRSHPAAITIVSCDPATLARDLPPLLGAGYRIAGMTLIDLFPQTFHIESVVKLVS
jgi:23S rRNA (uracil1939-C5)-methyltransferase